ncbi:MAG: hypothetical protein V7676_04910 [Parasphingorhabdus sp.]|uniref:hypothetical protein n=1 Tax=Parasphingorhabdus sp. TaxID=2709688 RepID=UPI003002DCAF
MVIVTIIVISIILMALFIGVTILGGQSHDRANETAKRRAREQDDRKSSEEDHDNGGI